MMPEPSPRPALQQRVAAAILDGAAHLFAGGGDQASMNEVAEAAGVARATVYRYFPNRESLLDELAQTAVRDVETRLASARVDEVPPDEGIARAVRALVDVGNLFVVLVRERQRSGSDQFQRGLVEPLRQLVERGQASGDIRDDITGRRLTESLIGLIVSMLTATPPLGREDMTATITGLFIDGARARGPRR
ncbi:TetR/AcrR family transcriptional regulator [Baekduia alba]|uniref:TetR/AcrR family transcriptional regulator n=1 Tax=Baekduia alba TaxID=2997333 RepID=UPI002340B928|nr:TetR/AcrR family transcriptional regulator [Baekduia alba]